MNGVTMAHFAGGPERWDDKNWAWAHSQGRTCSNCGEPVANRTRGNLCIVCRNKAKRNPWVQKWARRHFERRAELEAQR